MSYNEVVKTDTDLHTVIYEWTSADTSFGNANFMFQGGVTKAQPGLGEDTLSDVQSTTEDCNTIQSGRSSEEAQKIIDSAGE